MHNNITFSDVAKKELRNSIDWYGKRSVSTGENFIKAIDDAVNSICLNPETYPQKKLRLREFVVDKFPFIIVYKYRQKDNFVNVLHIFHTSRNPKHKYKR